MVFFPAVEKAEHIVSCLAQVVVSVDFGEWDSMWEPVDSEDVPALGSGWNVAFVAGVVIKGWTQVPTVNTMGCHVGLLHWSDVGDNSGARRGEGCVQELNALLRQEWADSFG